MKLEMRFLALAAALFTTSAHATWTGDAQVDQVNIGGNGLHGTFIGLAATTFTGCSVDSVAFVDASNPNYKEIMAAVLAAKLADKTIRLNYVGCQGAYPLIVEVLL